jgi:hypothetical protein
MIRKGGLEFNRWSKYRNVFFKRYDMSRKLSFNNSGFIKNKIKYIYINPNDLNFDVVNKELLNFGKYEVNKNYAFLIKVQLSNGLFRMVGNQFFWNSNSLSNKDYYDLYIKVLDQLDNYIEDYSEDSIVLIQIMFIELNPELSLQLKNIKNIYLDKGILNKSYNNKVFNDNYLPFSMDLSYYGIKLDIDLNLNGSIQKIYLKNELLLDFSLLSDKVKNEDINVNTILTPIKDISSYSVYLYTKKFKSHFKEFKEDRERKVILCVNNLNSESRKIDVYTLQSLENRNFKPKFTCVDTITNKNELEWKRSINNVSMFIRKNEIVKYANEVILPVIQFKDLSYDKFVINSLIGVLDLETYYDENRDKSFTYAIGFKIYRGETKMFYKEVGQSSSDLIIECLKSMLIPAYHNYKFYVHNLYNYDSIFILNAILDYNKVNDNYFKINTIFRDNRIIKLTISIKVGKQTNRKITLVDSYLLLNDSLKNLGNTFECVDTKGFFPYNFIKEDKLYYIGETPDISYYTNMNYDEYKILKSDNWDCKYETLKYLNKDLDLLMDIIDKFAHYVYDIYGVQITDSLTISKLAINILYTNYLKDDRKSLPLINNPVIYDFIKKSYFGGICEVYKPYGENLIYYDINSQYPFVAKNSIPGNKVIYMELLKGEIEKGESLELSQLFGFFYCKVKCNNSYLGLLPMHSDNLLVLPNGEFFGTWFSEELKFAEKYGYEIQVIKGYQFSKVQHIFNQYVDDSYNIRLNAIGFKKSISKFLLNSSFGRFGMSISKPETAIVDFNKLQSLLLSRKLLDIKELDEGSYLVNYDSKLSLENVRNFNLDISKFFNKNKDMETNKTQNFVSVSTASAITSYARIYINQIKMLILKLGGNVYYSDTDSIVTDIKLPKEYVGDEIGKFKLEYFIKRAIFITSKTYILELNDGTFIKKAKGINNESLSWKDYENMYLKNRNVIGYKTLSSFLWKEGTVNIIKDQPTIIKYNSYTKREKIYNSDSLWIDTKPLNYY